MDQSFAQLGVALLATASAIMTSVVTFLAPSEKANIYHEYSNRYWALRDANQKVCEIDCARSIAQLERI